MKNDTVTFAACSAVKEDAATKATWFQTFPPYGRYPVGGTVKGAADDAVFVFDEAAAKAVMDAFKAAAKNPEWPGVLVDEEHYSLDSSKSSAAMAWAKDIRQENDGSIWTRWEFTPKGRELWESKTLLNRSPAFACARNGKEYRPVELKSIAMTNTPHFSKLSTLAAARAAEVNNNKGEIHMKKLMAELGLAEDASEDAAVAACKALKDQASAATKAKDEALAECRRMKCDAFIEANKAKIADVAACRAAYMANPENAEKLIAACKAPEAKTQTVLAAAKKTPEVKKDGESMATCREQMAALPANERAAFYKEHKADIDAGK
jgi:phage I-like protein